LIALSLFTESDTQAVEYPSAKLSDFLPLLFLRGALSFASRGRGWKDHCDSEWRLYSIIE
jgi:hypothetical protein